MKEFYDEYTDDELTNEFDAKLQIPEEITTKVGALIEKATKNVSDIMEEERKNIKQKKNVEQNKKNFKQEIEGVKVVVQNDV